MSDESANDAPKTPQNAEAEAKRLRRERRRKRRAAEAAAALQAHEGDSDAPGPETAEGGQPPSSDAALAGGDASPETSEESAPRLPSKAPSLAAPPAAPPATLGAPQADSAAPVATPRLSAPAPTESGPPPPAASLSPAPAASGGAKTGATPAKQRQRPKKADDAAQKPAAGPASQVVPETALERARRDAIRARRRKGVGAVVRLLMFVIAPTLCMAYYLYYWATPYYESEAVFTIQSSETSNVPTLQALGMQFTGTADAQDAVTIQEFILSRNIMRRIESEKGYLSHFRRPEIDSLRRLSSAASEETQLEFYRRRIDVYFDPQDKVVTLAVQAADSAYAQEIAETLISYSEEKVNEISARIREDQLTGSEADLEKRRAALGSARQALLTLQQRYGEPDPTAILATIVGRKAQLEQNLALKSAEYEALRLRDAHETQAGRNLQLDMRALQREIDGVARQIADSAPKLAEFEAALFEKTTQEQIWVSALTAFEQAQIEALRQHRYLAVVNPALAPLDPKYPQVLRLTLLTLALTFFGFNIIALILAAVREHAKV